MHRIGLVLVCALLACSKGTSTASEGSGAPAMAPPPVGSAQVAPADAVAVPDAVALDAAVAAVTATGPTLSAAGGLSTLGKLDWSKQEDEDATTKLIQSKIGLPGVTVSFDVMDVPGEVETEEGYWSVKRGEKEIIQILRTSSDAGSGPAAVIVWSTDVSTADGIKVGDTVATVLAKHPDLICHGADIAETVPVDILCFSPAEKQLGYIVNAKKVAVRLKGNRKPASILNVDIVGLSHEF